MGLFWFILGVATGVVGLMAVMILNGESSRKTVYHAKPDDVVSIELIEVRETVSDEDILEDPVAERDKVNSALKVKMADALWKAGYVIFQEYVDALDFTREVSAAVRVVGQGGTRHEEM